MAIHIAHMRITDGIKLAKIVFTSDKAPCNTTN